MSEMDRDSTDSVRAFYERHPYPAPLANLDRHRELYRNPDRRRALSLLLWPERKPWVDREILVGGCGTSQAALYALREPEARVTAIDISEASLDHTRGLRDKYALRNLELRRVVIEEVGELGRTFDEIVCTASYTTCLIPISVSGRCAMSSRPMVRCM
jgi:SAM-dependent methyltransferase